ncbi:uncharacterized protein LOC110943949 [Helianthus annuus]|uniref:uncharacterized protein LOC110943949 n=1 Tax=Helianthus annuus TaxID=4232 RepID=UPI000B908BE2|nr:uncharacterized protein LOC110943949 [Helianthus annuus]
MGSPSEDSFIDIYLYRRFFSPEEIAEEEQVVTSACVIAIQAIQHVRRSPPRHILRRTFILRDREAANEHLMKDYFDTTPVHGPDVFRRRFRMSQMLFLRINDDLEAKYDYFKQRMDARGYLGFTSIQKVTSALRILAYGNTYDINDEYLKMEEKTTRDSVEYFCFVIWKTLLEKSHLERPSTNIQIYEHDEVNLHAVTSKDQLWFLQAVASYDIWVWLAFFGVTRCINDVNTFECSPLLESYISGTIPKVGFHANRNDYELGYYLGNAIRPIPHDGDVEEDYEEEEVEEFEVGNFSDGGLDNGENEEEK